MKCVTQRQIFGNLSDKIYSIIPRHVRLLNPKAAWKLYHQWVAFPSIFPYSFHTILRVRSYIQCSFPRDLRLFAAHRGCPDNVNKSSAEKRLQQLQIGKFDFPRASIKEKKKAELPNNFSLFGILRGRRR